MRALIVALCATLLLACSGFNKPISEPWPGQYDAELLYWCMPANGADGQWRVFAEKPEHCAEENISRGQWDHLPVTVAAEPSLVRETDEAIDYINRKLGFEMFQLVPEPEDSEGAILPDIYAFVAGHHSMAAARAQFLTLQGEQHGALLVYNGYEDKNHTVMMVHELGHFMGLRHDHDNYWSIMYPTLGNRPASLEPQDIRLIQALYRPLLREPT